LELAGVSDDNRTEAVAQVPGAAVEPAGPVQAVARTVDDNGDTAGPELEVHRGPAVGSPEDPGGAPNDAGTCPAVVGPAPHDRDVSRSAELELDVRGSRGIGVAQHPPVAPHHSRGGDTVAVPVADDRDVPGASELEREFRLAGTFHLADVPGE